MSLREWAVLKNCATRAGEKSDRPETLIACSGSRWLLLSLVATPLAPPCHLSYDTRFSRSGKKALSVAGHVTETAGGEERTGLGGGGGNGRRGTGGGGGEGRRFTPPTHTSHT